MDDLIPMWWLMAGPEAESLKDVLAKRRHVEQEGAPTFTTEQQEAIVRQFSVVERGLRDLATMLANVGLSFPAENREGGNAE